MKQLTLNQIIVLCTNDDFSCILDTQIIQELRHDLPRLFNQYRILKQFIEDGKLYYQLQEINNITINDRIIKFPASHFVVVNNNN